MIIESINKWYRYVFYRKYMWHKKMFGESDFPQISVMFDMSVVLITYLLATALLFDLTFEILIYHLLKPVVVAIYILIIAWHYITFVHKRKYTKLEKEFSEESSELRVKRGWFVVIYSVGSIVLLFVLIYLKYLGY